MDLPLIYCNGCSYSTKIENHKVHADYVGEALKGFVLNNSISGSCNRRIIRTSLYDILKQRKLNPKQKIIAFISLTFELRTDLWLEDITPTVPEESNFTSHQFSGLPAWKERLLSGKSLGKGMTNGVDKIENDMNHSKYFTKLNEGKAFYYSPYAERINLLADLIMFTSVCEKHYIDYLIFQGPKAEKLENEHLLDTFKDVVASDPQIFDLEEFGFCDWAMEHKFIPIDSLEHPAIGHYKSDAHKAFAEQILIPKLKETGQI